MPGILGCVGAEHATIFPYGPFRAGDGRQVMLGIQNEREWAKFCTGVLGRPELATDDKYNNNTKRTARRAEGGDTGVRQLFLVDLAEELHVARVRGREPPLDIVHAEQVEPTGCRMIVELPG